MQMTPEDIENLHFAYAGTAPMVHNKSSLDGHGPSTDQDEEYQRMSKEAERQRLINAERLAKEDAIRKKKAMLEDELLKGFQKTDPETQTREGPPVPPSAYFPQGKAQGQAQRQAAARQPAPTPAAAIPEVSPAPVGEASARLLETLLARVAKARNEGDFKLASELMAMAQETLASSNLKRTAPVKDRHPALQKLLSNLGLEKIKPVDVEWLGSTWRFAARTQMLDWWVGANMGPDGLEITYCLIAAGLIGLDGVPLYKVFNIPLTSTYTLEREDMNGLPVTIDIPIYQKTCESCASEVNVDAESCQFCGALLDPFDVPADLRLKYAISTKKLLQEKIGISAKDLKHLLYLYRKEQKDKELNKEELYPLLRLLTPLPKEEVEAEEVET